GRNFLIPVDAKIESESDVRYEAVDAGLILGKMEDAENDLNIVVLDACRDNPFSRSFRSRERGLSKMDAPKGSLLAYATAPGSVAADGTGRNGIFTKHLLKKMAVRGIKVDDVLEEVRIAVLKDTNNTQVPWQASSLTGEFSFIPKSDDQYLSGTKQDKESSKPKTIEPPRERLKQDTIFWESIKDSDNPKYFDAYLQKYPNGTFAQLAQLKIEDIKKEQGEDQAKEDLHINKSSNVIKPSLKVASIDPKDQEIARDDHYIAYSSGVVLDSKTDLEW
ncbi:MAG: caspase family protein, partial [Cytophagales bacterium]|nr:caspase family protein [Cytophagales bacterium]